MAYTGVYFKTNWERRIDKPFSDYYDLDTLKDFFNRVLTLSVKDKYEALDKQSRFDHMRAFIVYEKPLLMNNNRLLLQPLVVESYDPSTGLIKTIFPHNAIVGDTIEALLVGATSSFDGSLIVLSVPSSTELTAAPQAIGAFEAGQIITPQTIDDYLHFDEMKVTYKVKADPQIETIEATLTSVVIKLKTLSRLRNGERVVISGVATTTNANGTFYVRQVGTVRYQLYNDKDFADPVVGNAAYKAQSTPPQLFLLRKSKPMFQSKPGQIKTYDAPSIQFPDWVISENALLIQPKDNIHSIEFSYLRRPPFTIDPEDDTTDLLNFVPQEMIEYMIDKGAMLFDLETKDQSSMSMDAPQVIMNK